MSTKSVPISDSEIVPAVLEKPIAKPAGRAGRKSDTTKHVAIERMLLASKSWTSIQQELGCSRATICMVRKGLGDFTDEIKAEWQRSIDAKAMAIAEKLIDSMENDDMSKLAPDRKAIAYGILHDKAHPKSAAPISVTVAIQQTMDIARSGVRFKDI